VLWKAKLIIVAAALKCTGLLALPAVAASLGPANLRVEYLYQPLGVDLLGPRFFWQDVSKRQDARQTAHQLQVRQRGQDLWDSGKVLDPGPLLRKRFTLDRPIKAAVAHNHRTREAPQTVTTTRKG